MGMTTATNFASQPKRPVALVASLLWIAAIVLLVGTILKLTAAMADGRELERLAEQKARLQEEIAALSVLAEDAPAQEEILALAGRISQVNALTGARALPLQDVLGFLEGTIGADVRVSQFSYDQETGRLVLGLQAEDETTLPPVLRAIEASPLLQDVILQRQIRLQQGSRNVVQFDVEARAG